MNEKVNLEPIDKAFVEDEGSHIFKVNYGRLNELRHEYPATALELDLLSEMRDRKTGKLNPDYDQTSSQDSIELDILEVVDLLESQGHSGSSYEYIVNLLGSILQGIPITPLTGNDYEWTKDEWSTDENLERNIRYSKVYRSGERAWRLDARYFSEDQGKTWFTSGKDSTASVTFPFDVHHAEVEFVMVEPESDIITKSVGVSADDSHIVHPEKVVEEEVSNDPEIQS